MLTTSSEPDVNVCPLRVTMCAVQMHLSEKTLCQVTSSESRLFHWVVPLCCPRPAGLQKSLYTLGFIELHRQSRSSFYGILSYECDTFIPLNDFSFCSALLKGKRIPLQTWTGSKGSMGLRLPDFKTNGTRRW